VAYGLPLVGESCLFITLMGDDVFQIARSDKAFEYSLPTPSDLKLIQEDFGIAAWSAQGKLGTRADGSVVMLLVAVDPRG